MSFSRNKLEVWYENKKPKYNLSESGITFYNYNLISNLRIKDLIDISTYYRDSCGEYSLRKIIAQIYGCRIEDILITNGAAEGLFIMLSTIMRKYDEIIVIKPYFDNIDGIIDKLSLRIKNIFLETNNNKYFLDLNKLESLITQNTRAILINNPNNPTGYTYKKETIKSLNFLADKHDLIIVNDAITSDLNFNNEDLYKCDMPRILSLNGLSKSYGLPGLRIGWIIGDNTILEESRAIKENLSIFTATMCQKIAEEVLQNRNSILLKNKNILKDNLGKAEYFFGFNNNFELLKPDAGACCLVKYNLNMNSYTFCENMYKEKGILFTPGEIFGFDGFFRLGFGVRKREFVEGLNHLLNYN